MKWRRLQLETIRPLVLRAPLAGVLALLASITLGACSVILDPGSQCETTEDCLRQGVEGAFCDQDLKICQWEDWGCIGRVDPLPPVSPFVTWRARFVDMETGLPPADLEVDICPNASTNCDVPFAEGLRPTPDGLVEARLAAQFSGYARVSSVDLVPATVSLGRLVADVSVNVAATKLITNDLLMDYRAELGIPSEPNPGHARMLALNCRGTPAEGVRFTTDQPGAVTVYFDDDQPMADVAGTSSTTDDGLGAIFELPVGLPTFWAHRADNEEMIGNRAIRIREGVISYFTFNPLE